MENKFSSKLNRIDKTLTEVRDIFNVENDVIEEIVPAINKRLKADAQEVSDLNAVIASKDKEITLLEAELKPYKVEPSFKFINYLGDLLYDFTIEEILEMEELPEIPPIEGMIAQKWNWDLPRLKKEAERGNYITVGALYTTEDGTTKYILEFTEEHSSPALRKIYLSLGYETTPVTNIDTDAFEIDWGDGTKSTTWTTYNTSHSSDIDCSPLDLLFEHYYETIGSYVISVKAKEGWGFSLSGSSENHGIITAQSKTTASSNTPAQAAQEVIRHAVKGILLGESCTAVHGIYGTYLSNLEYISFHANINAFNLGYYRKKGTNSSYYYSRSTFSIYYTQIKSLVIPETPVMTAHISGSSSYASCPFEFISIPPQHQESVYYGVYVTYPEYLKNFTQVTYQADAEINYLYIYVSYNYSTPQLKTPIIYCTLPADKGRHLKLDASSNYIILSGIMYKAELDLSEAPPMSLSSCRFHYSHFTKILLPENSGTYKYVASYFLFGCPYIQEFIIADGLTTISSYAFAYTPQLTKIVLPDSITTLTEQNIFSYSGITEITIPSGVTKFGNSTFSSCTNLHKITLLGTITEYGSSCFYKTALTEVPDISNITTIPSNFMYGTKITEVTIPAQIKSIGDAAFNSTNLNKLTIEGTPTIYSNAFNYTKFKELTLSLPDDSSFTIPLIKELQYLKLIGKLKSISSPSSNYLPMYGDYTSYTNGTNVLDFSGLTILPTPDYYFTSSLPYNTHVLKFHIRHFDTMFENRTSSGNVGRWFQYITNYTFVNDYDEIRTRVMISPYSSGSSYAQPSDVKVTLTDTLDQEVPVETTEGYFINMFLQPGTYVIKYEGDSIDTKQVLLEIGIRTYKTTQALTKKK